MSIETLYPKAKKIAIAGKEFEVKRLPFKKFMEVTQLVSGFDFDHDMKSSADKMIDIIVIALNAEKSWLEENLMTEDVGPVFKEIMDMNNVPFKKPQDPGAGPAKE